MFVWKKKVYPVARAGAGFTGNAAICRYIHTLQRGSSPVNLQFEASPFPPRGGVGCGVDRQQPSRSRPSYTQSRLPNSKARLRETRV